MFKDVLGTVLSNAANPNVEVKTVESPADKKDNSPYIVLGSSFLLILIILFFLYK